MNTHLNKQQTIVAFVILTIFATMAGSGIWFYYTKYLTQDKKCITVINESKIDDPVKEEKEGLLEEDSGKDVTIAYERAGLFVGSEKADIKTKIVDPYIYYMNNVENGSKVAAVLVDKYPADERPSGYWFSITGILLNGGTNSWLEGSGGTIDYWKPECIEICQLTQSYVDAYPNNLPDEYNIK